MRIVFAGTPTFASVALARLLDAGHSVPLVLTQPDRPRGRGLKTLPSAVKALALQRDLNLLQPQSLRDNDISGLLAELNPELMVVAAYGLILPQRILQVPRLGCINIHASLLPRWRGAAPIPRALLAGDETTGISIMQMDQGLDTGAILMQTMLQIAADDTAQTLHDKLALLGGELVVEALSELEHGRLKPKTQATAGVSYAAKLTRQEAELNWNLSAIELERAVRAYNPYPVARTRHGEFSLHIWKAKTKPCAHTATPGTILGIDEMGMTVACGRDALIIEEAQRAGGKRLAMKDLIRGFPMAAGERLNFLDAAPSLGYNDS